MRTLVRIFLGLLVIGIAGAASYQPAMRYWKERNKPHWKTADVSRGDIVSVVNSTGEVKPVLSITIGSFVSGPIKNIYADFNDEVKSGDLLAEIDPELIEAGVKSDEALLATARAEVERSRAQAQQARNDEARAIALRQENEDYISDTEMDQFKFTRQSLEAQLRVAQASVAQAEANLQRSRQNLLYTKITAPDDGIIIERKIDRGQTLAAQFQTPEMFVLAPRMREKMHVFASVDEADIGLVRAAQDADQPVRFTVDAYPEELFEGRIEQIRLSSTTTQNVVTYPVVVAATNPDLKLLPGMTATISFQIDQRTDIVRIPNSALRFYPDRERVHEDDRPILDGREDDGDDSASSDAMLSAEQRAEAVRSRRERHVWVFDGQWLRAVPVTVGMSDNRYSELVEGDLQIGRELVTGIKPKSK